MAGVAAWQARLTPSPQTLQRLIIRTYMGSLNYWCSRYRYCNNVERGDVVFLTGIAARLVHNVMQVLSAINKTYCVADGSNLNYVLSMRALRAGLFMRSKGDSWLYTQTSEVCRDLGGLC
jgi:hypothetical protein